MPQRVSSGTCIPSSPPQKRRTTKSKPRKHRLHGTLVVLGTFLLQKGRRVWGVCEKGNMLWSYVS